jgi:hypothetical protein
MVLWGASIPVRHYVLSVRLYSLNPDLLARRTKTCIGRNRLRGFVVAAMFVIVKL